jgi:hypothetical protein
MTTRDGSVRTVVGMTASTPMQTALPPAVRRERTVLVVIGSVLAGLGSLVAIAGVALLVVFGSDGSLSSGRQDVNTPTAALVSGVANITDTTHVSQALGDTSIQVSAAARGDRDVFVGVARRADVDRYLAGAAVDEITDFDVAPFRLTRDRRDGSATPQAPGDQTFWVAQSSGSKSAAINWKVRDGSYRIVVMNADGSRRVATETTVGVTVENLPDLAWTILVIGLVLGAGGVLTLVLTLRRR